MRMVQDDPTLERFNNQIRGRYELFKKKKAEIESVEGSLENFASGYQSFGLHQREDGLHYQEWAPGAVSLYLVLPK